MSKLTFNKVPSINSEDSFIGGAATPIRPTKKIKGLCLKVPEQRWLELHQIMEMSGLTMNAICNEFIRVGIKEKMKDLKEEY